MEKIELHIMADYQTDLLSEAVNHSCCYFSQIRRGLPGFRKEVTHCHISTSRGKAESWYT